MTDNKNKVTSEERERAEWIAEVLAALPEREQNRLYGVIEGARLFGASGKEDAGDGEEKKVG